MVAESVAEAACQDSHHIQVFRVQMSKPHVDPYPHLEVGAGADGEGHACLLQ